MIDDGEFSNFVFGSLVGSYLKVDNTYYLGNNYYDTIVNYNNLMYNNNLYFVLSILDHRVIFYDFRWTFFYISIYFYKFTVKNLFTSTIL